MKDKLTSLDYFGYYVTVILTMGAAWGLKCVIKKAMVEAQWEK